MKLAILHYHLNPGGVTRVIANHLHALDAGDSTGPPLEVLVLYDGQRAGWPHGLIDGLHRLDVRLMAVPRLAYDVDTIAQPDVLARELKDILTRHGCQPDATVIHAHNYSLGKNGSLPGALRRLAGDGYRFLLQIHDFAEDFRPENYRHLRESCAAGDVSQGVYFQAPLVHYATLNRRDFSVLRAAGVADERLHFLPNPVPELGELPSREAAKAALESRWGLPKHERYVLYPVRGIRRKNTGEMLLLSVLVNSAGHTLANFAMTLAPLNPAAVPFYHRWTSLARELQLPCLFDTGGKGGLSFLENVAAADSILTTSVAEGFGMAFLESWLAGRPLVGRNLPEITADFVDAGLQLDALYERLAVPLEWVGRDDVITAMQDACRELYAHYDAPLPDRANIEAAVDRMTHDGLIDFGRLDEPLQERVIRRAHSDASARDELVRLNPALARWDDAVEPSIANNQRVIRGSYSVQASGVRLRSIYRALIDSRRGAWERPADARVILSAFIDLNRFHLIRT